jgi:hypothetical protein
MKFPLFVLVLVSCLSRGILGAVHLGPPKTFQGMCDASGGVALTEDLIVVADDETNILRIYSKEKGGAPVSQIHLNSFLQAGIRNPEGDLEAAAKVGDVIYWISSHARNKNGKPRESRDRFFATKIITTNAQPTLQLIGRPYRDLLRDLIAAPQLKKFNLAEASLRAPKEDGALNIEGLCAGPDGSVLIGFRNPVPKGKALIVPFLNPADVISLKARPRLGEPLLIDLEGHAVRDMLSHDGVIYIISGSPGVGGHEKLFVWDGKSSTPESLGTFHPHGGNPEALLEVPGHKSKLYMLTDEGTRQAGGAECKDLPFERRTFRGFTVKLKD